MSKYSYESIVSIPFLNYKVRIWIHLSRWDDNNDVAEKIKEYIYNTPIFSTAQMADQISTEFNDDISCVEVTENKSGFGNIVYIDWP